MTQKTLGIIGRERAIIDRLTKRLHAEAQRHADYGAIRQISRGNEFEVRIEPEPGMGHRWIARVSVEFVCIEDEQL